MIELLAQLFDGRTVRVQVEEDFVGGNVCFTVVLNIADR